MDQRISIVTLGRRDLEWARAFYEALGRRSNSKPEDGVVFFQTGSMIVGLRDRDELDANTRLPE